MKEIPLTNTKMTAKVDDQDYEAAMASGPWRWDDTIHEVLRCEDGFLLSVFILQLTGRM